MQGVCGPRTILVPPLAILTHFSCGAQTGKHENNETPQWDFCCYVHGHHEHSEFFFSVFDADFSGDEGDWLGTAVLPGNATAGSYELALSGGEFEIDADAPPPTLTVSIPLFPPPPPPPQNIDAVKVPASSTRRTRFGLLVLPPSRIVEPYR